MLLFFDDEPQIAPHPDLVAVQRPSPRDVLLAVSVMGWLPGERLEPAVSA